MSNMASTHIRLLFFVGFLCRSTANNDVDKCASNPCDDGSTCENTPGSYKCHYIQHSFPAFLRPVHPPISVATPDPNHGEKVFNKHHPDTPDTVKSRAGPIGDVDPGDTDATSVKETRLFMVVKPQQATVFHVDVATADTLKSGLTTIFLPIVYVIVFAVGLPTNAMAIWVFLFRTKKKNASAIYMANLALSDLLFVIWTPLKIAYHVNGNNWIYGEVLCKVMTGFFYGNMYGSVLFIACLSVQRYWVVAHPLSQQSKNRKVTICVSVSIWVFIWLSTTPLYLYEQTVKLQDPNITTCHDVTVIYDREDPFASIQYAFYYFVSMAGLAFLVPSIVIIVAYVLLLRALGNAMADGEASKKRRKAVFLIVTVLVTFLVCFIPSNVMLVNHYFKLKDGVCYHDSYRIYITSLCLASLNSCLDPLVYYYVSDDFRDHVKNTLLCMSERTVERMKVRARKGSTCSPLPSTSSMTSISIVPFKKPTVALQDKIEVFFLK